MANWQALNDDEWTQTSFASLVPAPNTEPDADPTVCVQIATAWLPYVLGALYQLTQPGVWDPASAGADVASEQAQALMALFSSGGACIDMLQFQFDSACNLQVSTDGGATWTDVPGWSTYAPDCFTGPAGPAGPAGGYTPGTPPIQPGQTTDELACAVAGYLASELIVQSMSSLIGSINHGETVLQATTALVAFIPEVNVILAPVVGAAAILYNIINSGSLSHYTFAETDPTLLSDLTCAIYAATSADGYVTDTNFSAVVAAIAAISYVYPDVISGIVSYLDAGGALLMETAQIPGALASVDCSGCGGPSNWCFLWNLAITQGAWFNPYGSSCCGTWNSGIGFEGQDDGTNVEIDIQIAVSGGGTIDSIEFNAAIFNTPGPSNFIGWHDSGGWHSVAPTLTNDGMYHTYGATPSLAGIDMIWIRIMTVSPSASPPIISAVSIRGHGASNPFGTTNCV